MSEILLPEGARLIHIGPPKTGTTSLQTSMAGAREAMAAQGAYYPKGPHRRRKAGWALGLTGAPAGVTIPISHWEDLVAEVRDAGDRRVCVSDENYSRARSDIAGRIVDGLGGERVHVVTVARRLDRVLPSYWQERVKNGHAGTFEQWLELILGDEENGERWRFWQSQDTARLVERWLQFVEPDRFTLVIADESDRLQLPHLFERMLGLTEGTLQPVARGSNESLSWTEVEMIRALHPVYAANGWERQELLASLATIVNSLRAQPDHGTGPRSPSLPAGVFERARELSDERIDRLRELPVRVIGDPELLRVPPEPPADAGVRAEDLTVPIGLAAALVEGVLRAERQRVKRLQRDRAGDPARRPVADVSGRDLLQLAARRALGRLKGR